MNGYFDKFGKPRVTIGVVGRDKLIHITPLIDTGFDGALMLSVQDALKLGLQLTNIVPVELADGTVKNELVFAGLVILDSKEIPADIMLTTAESLLGTAVLQKHQLTIDFPNKTISLIHSISQPNFQLNPIRRYYEPLI